MKLRIDCYSKEEIGIEPIFLKDDQLPKSESTDLVLFAGYTLRQLNDLAGHPVAKALDGYLVSKQHFESLLKGKPIWPLARQLFSDLSEELYSRLHDDENPQQFLNSWREVERQIDLDDATINLLNGKILAPMPKVVTPHGNAKKWFEFVAPPGLLEMKGLGFLFGDMHFYIYHSVLALAQFFAAKHKNDEPFLIYLSESATLCAGAHIFGQITNANQMQLAVNIVDKVGALKHYDG